MHLLTSSEKQKILKKLNEYYGITKIPHLLIQFGKEKIRGYSGNLSREEINKLDNNLRIEILGIYLFHNYGDEIRLSLDALHIFKNQITKNIIELITTQADEWFHGNDITLTKPISRGFKILKFKQDLIGCGKSTGEIIKNYMPKERRVK